MPVISSNLDPRSAAYAENRAAMLARLDELDEVLSQARAGGGEKYVARHHARGKLLPRERIELLLDRDAPFLELSPAAGHGLDVPVGAGVVTGIGLVEGVPCVVVANDPTVRGGTVGPYTLRKIERATEIAAAHRLAVLSLIESAGPDLAAQAELYVPSGALVRDLARLGVPTVAVVFGTAHGGQAHVPGLADYTIFVRDQAKVFLGGPALVRAVTGEETDDESLGGALMHATRSGLADFVAVDERDAIRLCRLAVARHSANQHSAARPGPGQPDKSGPVTGPLYDPEDLLGVPSADVRTPFDPREILARVVDGSEFDEFKPLYGTGLVTGWATVYGRPVGVLANARGPILSEEAQKAEQFVQLAQAPLLFLQNTTGYMVGSAYEQGGIIRHGARMMSAVANSAVPHLTVTVGAAYGAGGLAMGGRAFRPRFLFAWPNARSAMIMPQQVHVIASIDDTGATPMREYELEAQSGALAMSGRLNDDGVIDPRDTRTVLGLCLSLMDGVSVPARAGTAA
jgi:acetyl-CoA carboxylase carboxyltransferase component